MADINFNPGYTSSGAFGAVYSRNSLGIGDLGQAAMCFFAERASGGGKDLKDAMDKARSDKDMNRQRKLLEESFTQNGSDGNYKGLNASAGTTDPEVAKLRAVILYSEATAKAEGSQTYALWKHLTGTYGTGQTGLEKLNSDVFAGNDDIYSVAEKQKLMNIFAAQFSVDSNGRAINDDSINLTLVQLSLQEFNNAVNGGSSSGKAIGDQKKSITDRF